LPLRRQGNETRQRRYRDGNVVCKIIPPAQLSDADKAAKLALVRQLLDESREHSKRVPANVIERKIRHAMKTVREGR